MYCAALDLSGNEAVFALQRAGAGDIVCEGFKPMRGRTASGLVPWILGLLQEHGVTLEQITHWTVGSGPGSFTGMRLAAAFVAGLTAENTEIKSRCVPTAVALAYGLEYNDGDRIATLFDGRNQEILVYPLVFSGGELKPYGEPAVLDREQAPDYFEKNHFEHFTVHRSEQDAIARIIQLPLTVRDGLKPVGLLNAHYAHWNNDLTALVYIRPAVHTN